MKLKYFFTSQIDNRIREIYWKRGVDKKSHRIPGIKELARELHWPKWVLNRRARVLGLARTRNCAWSREEMSILERYAHLTNECIQNKLAKVGFQRTVIAIRFRIQHLRLRKNTPFYSANALAECFGVDHHCITRWIRLGYLRAKPRGTLRRERQGGDTLLVHEKDIRKFIIDHPAHFDMRKCDQLWLIDLLANRSKL
jgi:hypothetical protein